MRKIISIYLLFLICTTVRAQTISGGIKAGYNLTRLSISGRITDPVLDNDWISSFHIGGFVRKSIGSKGALQIELLYSPKGCRFELASLRDDNLRLNYINLPVLLNFQLTRNVVFEAGPELGYLFGFEQNIYNKFDLGAVAGVRYDLGKKIGVGIRYCHGLASLATFRFTSGSNVLRNQTLQASIAYTLFN